MFGRQTISSFVSVHVEVVHHYDNTDGSLAHSVQSGQLWKTVDCIAVDNDGDGVVCLMCNRQLDNLDNPPIDCYTEMMTTHNRSMFHCNVK